METVTTKYGEPMALDGDPLLWLTQTKV
jgi:hypothetical protein